MLMGVVLYHGTLTRNIPSILEHGIVPRTEEDCRKLVEEKGIGVKGDVKEWALRRCLDTVGRISLSGNRGYAISNCRAGLEVEMMLEASARGVSEAKVWEEIKEREPCSVVEVNIPADIVPKRGGGRWEGLPLGEILDKAYEALGEKFYKTYDEVKEVFDEFIFDRVPRAWIRTHYPVEGGLKRWEV